jgi:hypothetical protein
VDEQQTPEAGRPRTGRAAAAVGIVLAAAAVAAALFVVATSIRKVKPEPLPPALQTAPPDTALVVFRASMRRKVMNLSARCESKRKRFDGRMTPGQDSLGRECDSAIASVLVRIAAFDTVKRENRNAASDSVKAEYERAKLKVRTFTRSGLRGDTIDEDSLDEEIKRLISE